MSLSNILQPSGQDIYTIYAKEANVNTFNALTSEFDNLAVDQISEKNLGGGVTMMDDFFCDLIQERTVNNGVLVSGVLCTFDANVNLQAAKEYRVNGTPIKDLTETLTNKTLDAPGFTGAPTGTISSGSYTPTITLQGGAAWDLTGHSAEGHYMRIGNRCHVTIKINITAGTAGTSANLGLVATIPINVTASVSGICNANVNSVAATNPASAMGTVSVNDVDKIGLNLVGYAGVARAGISADQHFVNASFMYDC